MNSGRGGEGARNMKSIRLPQAAIFFMTYFYRTVGGGMPPPPYPLLTKDCIVPYFVKFFENSHKIKKFWIGKGRPSLNPPVTSKELTLNPLIEFSRNYTKLTMSFLYCFVVKGNLI